jgi:hypothetical protein
LEALIEGVEQPTVKFCIEEAALDKLHTERGVDPTVPAKTQALLVE